MLSLVTKIGHVNTPLLFSVDVGSLIVTAAVFAAIYFVIFLFNLISAYRAKPIELLRGSSVGEREPKTKWILTVIGLAALGGGYAIALLVKSPLTAVLSFFAAVILVIVGTYLLFATGSITVLKSLRGNRRYYYKTGHFINVSGMIYRMKQNAVGLANICILSTMVLVMISTTAALNLGVEDMLDRNFPEETVIKFGAPSDELPEKALSEIRAYSENVGVELKGLDSRRVLSFSMRFDGKAFNIMDSYGVNDKGAVALALISADGYSDDISLKNGQALVEAKGFKLPEGFNLLGLEMENAGPPKSFPVPNENEGIVPAIANLVVTGEDFARIREACTAAASRENEPFYFQYLLSVYFTAGNLTEEQAEDFAAEIYEHLASNLSEEKIGEDGSHELEGYIYAFYSTRASEAEQHYSMYGGFLFLGISLGLMFMMATVLIIYYKQITEGYNDKNRFIIMQKVGLSKQEIKKSIRSQILTVFFLPLIVAVIHVCVAFGIITKLLAVLSLTNVTLFALCTGGTIAVFAAFYLIVYALTAREYYKIVSSEG
jgi:putative ABC transport system permease protein